MSDENEEEVETTEEFIENHITTVMTDEEKEVLTDWLNEL